jgi:hypothetical protein
LPGTERVPASALRIPARIVSRVVLPAPFGPITANSSPRLASNETPRNAGRPSNALLRSRAEIAGAVGSGVAAAAGIRARR